MNIHSISTLGNLAALYQDNRVPVRKAIASILHAGIFSDTEIPRSATTTETDRLMADSFSTISDLPIDGFGKDIMGAASLVARRPVDEIMALDRKDFGEGKTAFTVSQVEVNTTTEIMDRRDEIMEGLERQQAKTGNLFTALMVTGITELDSALSVKGDPVFLSRIRYPEMEENVYMPTGILSRRKQLVPFLTELIGKSP